MSGQDDFEPRQIFIAHEAIWEHMVAWARVHHFHLDLIPTTDADGNLTLDYSRSASPDPTPTYGFMPRLPGDR